jgi:hypothetical protein
MQATVRRNEAVAGKWTDGLSPRDRPSRRPGTCCGATTHG